MNVFHEYKEAVENHIRSISDMSDEEVQEEASQVVDQYGFLFEEDESIKEVGGVRMKESVIIYSKDKCQACKMVMKRFNNLGVDYVVKHLEEKENMDAVKALGARQAPVVVYKGEHHSGFSLERIDAIAKDQKLDLL